MEFPVINLRTRETIRIQLKAAPTNDKLFIAKYIRDNINKIPMNDETKMDWILFKNVKINYYNSFEQQRVNDDGVLIPDWLAPGVPVYKGECNKIDPIICLLPENESIIIQGPFEIRISKKDPDTIIATNRLNENIELYRFTINMTDIENSRLFII
jgi:hypothetical protein